MTDQEELVLTEPRTAVAKWVLIGIAFVVAGVLAILFGSGFQRFIGILAVALFGFVLFLGVFQMFKPDQLVITDEGFIRRSYPFQAEGRFLRWEQVTPFEVGVGGRGGPTISFNQLAEGAEPTYSGYGQVKNMGMDAFELADLLNERRSRALGESEKKGAATPKAMPTEPAAAGRGEASIEFPASPTGRAPAVTGPFVCIAHSLFSASSIARRFGEKPVAGTVDGEQVKGFVAQITELGPMVFVKARAGSRVFVQTDADQDEAYDIARAISRGRIRRVGPS